MAVRTLRRGILLLIPIYLFLAFIGFFAFFWSHTGNYTRADPTENPDFFGTSDLVVLGGTTFNSSHIPGVLNLHVWEELCGADVDRLRNSPVFPLYPHKRLFLQRVQVMRDEPDYAQRIFGFIHPWVTGFYAFGISSDDSSELWLSFDETPQNVRLIARVFSPTSDAWTDQGVLTKYYSQLSRNYIRLVAGNKYFIEVLHKQGVGNGHVKVSWRKPGSHRFESITREYLSSYYDDRDLKLNYNLDYLNLDAFKWMPSHTKQDKNTDFEVRLPFNYTSIQFLDRKVVQGILPSCHYKPSYIVERKLERYEGVGIVHVSAIFPDDNTYLNTPQFSWSRGNELIDNETVDALVTVFMVQLQRFQRKYYLQRILNVEMNPDPENGKRFLLELQLGMVGSNDSFRLSEYVFVPSESEELCFPEGIEWYRNATVYFILPVKNQGRWLHHFVKQLANMAIETGDLNFHVVVVDFDSQDIDVEKLFNVWPVWDRYTLIRMNGPFYKTLALQKAAAVVPNHDDIVFLFDLHIDVPVGLLDSVRKYTVFGKIAYAPIVGRLICGMTSRNPLGYWQENGYGLLSVYKADWNRFGGMNVEEFTTKWGGEDWDLLDRVLLAKLEVERLKQPGLFHYYHTHKGMWQQ